MKDLDHKRIHWVTDKLAQMTVKCLSLNGLLFCPVLSIYQ